MLQPRLKGKPAQLITRLMHEWRASVHKRHNPCPLVLLPRPCHNRWDNAGRWNNGPECGGDRARERTGAKERRWPAGSLRAQDLKLPLSPKWW